MEINKIKFTQTSFDDAKKTCLPNSKTKWNLWVRYQNTSWIKQKKISTLSVTTSSAYCQTDLTWVNLDNPEVFSTEQSNETAELSQDQSQSSDISQDFHSVCCRVSNTVGNRDTWCVTFHNGLCHTPIGITKTLPDSSVSADDCLYELCWWCSLKRNPSPYHKIVMLLMQLRPARLVVLRLVLIMLNWDWEQLNIMS